MTLSFSSTRVLLTEYDCVTPSARQTSRYLVVCELAAAGTVSLKDAQIQTILAYKQLVVIESYIIIGYIYKIHFSIFIYSKYLSQYSVYIQLKNVE